MTGYRRSLDIENAVARVEFSAGGVQHSQEVFASFPRQVLAVGLTASGTGNLSFAVGFGTSHPAQVSTEAGSGLRLRGEVEGGAIRFEARLAVQTDGTVSVDGERLRVQGATEATLLLAGATNFVNFRDVSGDPSERNAAVLAEAAPIPYQALRNESSDSHRQLFQRVRLDLGATEAAAEPTDARIERFASRPDPQLVALLFQYGRYLLIASSRGRCQPANLQGLWNDLDEPPWDSKYTVNINTEMNYWPAESTGLPETHEPLFAALREIAVSGAETAREHYGARGWVLHHNFDLWRGTAPINHSNHGIWPTGGAWLCQDLWQHYLYGGDEEFLRETAYPLMKGASEFFLDALVESPDGQWLISGPSNSPENGGLVMGPTMDHQIIRNLLGNTISAAAVLGLDSDFREELRRVRERIAPNRIGRLGQLQEWLDDVDDPDNQHRHVSHLFGLHPGVEITPFGTPDLFAAARKSLEFRGDGATGWSMGWKVNFWARFLDGDHAFKILAGLLAPVPDETARRLDGRGLVCTQPVRRAPAVPDRRQFRRDCGHCRDAAAEPRPARRAAGRQLRAVGREWLPTLAARASKRPCQRQGGRLARSGRVHRGSRVARHATPPGSHPVALGQTLQGALRRDRVAGASAARADPGVGRGGHCLGPDGVAWRLSSHTERSRSLLRKSQKHASEARPATMKPATASTA